ncbi:LysR family transcriptional regulator [Pseudooceanicola sp. CBS1P-1]|uniref:LysR family transcriptional regulator n=1 Tax=Pseudooceanicola albus TaxID=2692189 RepID=A0A6L7G4R5_9RHOB|nr:MULTISPECIES: LysR family transcriptional regulator [Pseudooceanicola]MBT9385449.1 LysR family transcriptional regulator [Pseudooceanicola endophyticus]MXN18692.1 LysR family transcriptional regulator [Pseudooceanicola albus]
MTLRSKVPTTGSLFVFDAAARHLNFTNAAREFNVTQPAVSRSIRALEQHLGCPLFERNHAGLELTEQGRFLHEALQGGFSQIEHALDELKLSLAEEQTVSLSITSAFALHWLMPRLPRLKALMPDISLRFELIHGEPEGPMGRADLAIRYDWAPGPGITIWPAIDELVIPVCSPDYLARHGYIDDPDVQPERHSLGELTARMWEAETWEVFLNAVQLDPMTGASRMAFSDYGLVLQSALKGQCVALGWWHVVAGELESGELVPASRRFQRDQDTYCFVARGNPGAQREAVQRVLDWLLEEYARLEEAFRPVREAATIY